MIPQELIPVEEGKFHIPADAVNYDDRVKVLNHSDTLPFLTVGAMYIHMLKKRTEFFTRVPGLLIAWSCGLAKENHCC